MRPFQKILVPVDFSAHSQEATLLAADLSSRYKASTLLVYVYEPIAYALPEGYVLYTPAQIASLLSEFEKRLSQAKRDAEAAGALNVTTRLLQGIAAPEIVRVAEDDHIDLIVMGTHGRTGLQHVLMGSVAERVTRLSPCPVLTTKAAVAS